MNSSDIMKIAKKVMKEDKEVLDALADGDKKVSDYSKKKEKPPLESKEQQHRRLTRENEA